MKMNFCLVLSTLWLAGFSASAADAAKKPESKTKAKPTAKAPAKIAKTEPVTETPGTVKDARVNVRGQATLNSEVITQLKKGEAVTVLGEVTVPNAKKDEPAKWLKIALPANTPVWVNKLFLTNNTVLPPKLNVRGGPGENFSVLARLEKGATVKPLRTTEGWVEIETPRHAIAYVAAEHIALKAAEPTTQIAVSKTPPPATLTPPPPTEVVAVKPATPLVIIPPTPPVEPPTVPAITPVVQPAPVAQIPPVVKPVVEKPVVVPPTTVEPPLAVTEPTNAIVINEAPKQLSWWEKVFGPREKKVVKLAETNKVAELIETEPGPVRIITREGVVRRSYNIQAPSDWALEEVSTGRTINYLYNTQTNIPWKTLKGRTVVVTGEEAIDKRWPNTPIIKIESLKTLE